MIRMRALNVDTSDESENDEDIQTVTKEAHEQSAFTQYNKALILLGEDDFNAAGEILRVLLESSFLAEYQVPDGADNSKPPELMLKYSCLKNLASIVVKQGDVKAAIELYLQASRLDGSDVSLWYQIGTLGIEVIDYKLAVEAFLEGLHNSPRHWPCLDKAITMLFVTNDYITCLYFVSRSLALEPGYLKGLAFRDHIITTQPCLLEIFKEYYPDQDLGNLNEDYNKTESEPMVQEALEMKIKLRDKFKHLFEPEVLPTVGLLKPLSSQTWLVLAEALLSLYNHLDSNGSLLSPISLTDCVPAVASDGEQDMELQVEAMEVEKEEEPPDEEAGTLGKKHSFLEQWISSNKRRSGRVRSTARGKEAGDDLGHVLSSLFPRSLLPSNNNDITKCADDSQDTMELFKLFDQIPSTADSTCEPQAEGYFATAAEYHDVEEFLASAGDRIGDIIMDLLKALSVKWQMHWPAGLTRLYKQLYVFARRFHIHPSLSKSCDWLRDNALVSLVYAELMLDDMPVDTTRLCEEIGFVMPVILTSDMSLDHTLRCFWLSAHVMLALGQHEDRAMQNLEAAVDLLESDAGPREVRLVNCISNPLINSAVANKLLATLTTDQSLCQVRQLYDSADYETLVEILKVTLENGYETLRCDDTDIPDRHEQLTMLVEALSQLEHHKEALYCGEACLNEALAKYLKCADSSASQQSWSETVAIVVWYVMHWLDDVGLTLLDTINTDRLSRLVQNLTHIVCHQLNVTDTVAMPIDTILPWILLQVILQHYEVSASPSEEGGEEEAMPASLRILMIAHDRLAKRSWCTSNEGALLRHMIDVFIPKLNDPALASSRDELTLHVEQAVFCLYGHISRKTKTRVTAIDHGVPNITLTWQRVMQLYQVYCPPQLPEFDGYREGCISAETELLLKRFTTLVPTECDPTPVLEELKRYIDGHTDELPSVEIDFPHQIASLYYVLADYYFKNSEWSAASEHYMLDICVNPLRLDSWAGCALSIGSRLETALNSCAMTFSENVFLRHAATAQRCYQRALEINNEYSLLWIEFGSFVYMVHSFCCRHLKQDNEGMNMQTFVQVESQKEEMLKLAVKCFSTANKAWYRVGDAQGAQDERWLHHYMLGKAAEKRGAQPEVYLSEYECCVMYLHSNGAEYPLKVSYNNSQILAVEALEVYYRIHAAILKYMEARESKGVEQNARTLFHAYIDRASKGPFVMREGKVGEEETRKRMVNERMGVDVVPAKRQRCETDRQLTDVEEKILDEIVQASVMLGTEDVKEDGSIQVSDKLEVNITLDIGGQLKERKEMSENDVAGEKICDSVGERNSPRGAVYSNYDVVVRTDNPLEDRDGIIKSMTNFQKDEPNNKLSEEDSRESSTTASSSSEEDLSDSSSSDQSDSTRTQEDEPELLVLDNWDIEQKCVHALEQCVLRFPTHYKSLYRLAHFYFHSKQRRDLTKCRELLLGSYRCIGGETVAGLFSDRKSNNLFNGVWRIPTSEIDRAGSFASHMSRCVQLLMELLTKECDHALLLTVCIQLRVTPDTDKKYLRDTEREQLSRQAFALCLRAVRSKIDEKTPKALVIDVYKCYRRIQKRLAHKEKVFAGLLLDAYMKHTKTDGSTVDSVIRWCLQECIASRDANVVNTATQLKPAASRGLLSNVPQPTVFRSPNTGSGSTQQPISLQECVASRAANVVNTAAPVTPAASRGLLSNVPQPTGFDSLNTGPGSTQQPISLQECVASRAANVVNTAAPVTPAASRGLLSNVPQPTGFESPNTGPGSTQQPISLQECVASRAANVVNTAAPVTPAASRGLLSNVPQPTRFESPNTGSGSTQQPISVAKQQYVVATISPKLNGGSISSIPNTVTISPTLNTSSISAIPSEAALRSMKNMATICPIQNMVTISPKLNMVSISAIPNVTTISPPIHTAFASIMPNMSSINPIPSAATASAIPIPASVAGYKLDHQIKASKLLNYQTVTELMRRCGTNATPVTKTSLDTAPSTSARPTAKQSQTPQTSSSSVNTSARRISTVKPSTANRNPLPASVSILKSQISRKLKVPKPLPSKPTVFLNPTTSHNTIEIARAQLLHLTSKHKIHGLSLTAIDSSAKNQSALDKDNNPSPFAAHYSHPQSLLPASSHLGSEMTVTSANSPEPLRLSKGRDGQYFVNSSKPYDLAAIPKGITVLPIEPKKIDLREQNMGRVKVPIAKNIEEKCIELERKD